MTHKTGLVIGTLGLIASLASGWFVVRGPFFGYAVPPVEHLLAACAVFIAATYLFAWGLDANFRADDATRPDIDEHQNQTMDMPFGPR